MTINKKIIIIKEETTAQIKNPKSNLRVFYYLGYIDRQSYCLVCLVNLLFGEK